MRASEGFPQAVSFDSTDLVGKGAQCFARGCTSNRTAYTKDGINNYVIHERADAVNPEKTGTKAAAHYLLTVAAGESRKVRLRLSDVAPRGTPALAGQGGQFGTAFDAIVATRQQECSEFYK